MTDNEIKKALEELLKNQEDGYITALEYGGKRDIEHEKTLDLFKNTFDLINRLQAKNESLQKDSKRLKKVQMQLDDAMKMYFEIKAEAYKEFAELAVERVEKAKQKYQRLCKEQGEEMEEHMHIHFNGITKIINNLLKEMVGDGNVD